MGHSHLLPPTEQATTDVPWAVCSSLLTHCGTRDWRACGMVVVVVVVCAGREPTTEAKSTTTF